MKKPFKTITFSAAALLALSLTGQQIASAASFKDINNVQGKEKIMALQNIGLIKGITEDMFGPNKPVSQAESVQMIVNALGLNLDLVRFVKEPKASDYFVNAKDSAWYANAFIIAAVNGMELPKDLNPNKKLTREEFTHQLIHTIEIAGKLPMINPVVTEYKDEDQVKIDYSGSIQRALNYGVVKLDAEGKFNPKKEITRAEAAVEISNALDYLKAHSGAAVGSETLTMEQAVKMIKDLVGADSDLQIKIDPNAAVTRESFTNLLVHTLQTSGKLPMLKLVPKDIKDNDKIDLLNQGAIQTALALGFVQLDENGNFNPKDSLTQAEASAIVNKAAEYLKAHSAPGTLNETLTMEQAVKLIKDAAGPDSDLQIKIDPNATVTRESFTNLLIHTLQTAGKLPMLNLIPVEIKDNSSIDILNQGAIQTALALKIAALDENGNFNPKSNITVAEATAMVDHVKETLKGFSASK